MNPGRNQAQKNHTYKDRADFYIDFLKYATANNTMHHRYIVRVHVTMLTVNLKALSSKTVGIHTCLSPR